MVESRPQPSRQYLPVWSVCHIVEQERYRISRYGYLWLEVSIFQFWVVYRTVRKKDFVALARVNDSRQYFQFVIVYHTVTQEGCPGFR